MTDPWSVVAGLGSASRRLGRRGRRLLCLALAAASRATSRDALEALAVGIKPHLHMLTSFTATGDIVLNLRNASS